MIFFLKIFLFSNAIRNFFIPIFSFSPQGPAFYHSYSHNKKRVKTKKKKIEDLKYKTIVQNHTLPKKLKMKGYYNITYLRFIIWKLLF